MGFMDKAKKLAEQAQQKLDEAQEQFNQGQGSSGGQGSTQEVRYDQHGRPTEGSPAGETPPPSAEPVDAGPEPGSGSNANPDPFKPIQ
jgi:hypothetical protein